MTLTAAPRTRRRVVPAVVMAAGLLAVIVGWRLMASAASMRAYWQDVSDYSHSFGGYVQDPHVAQAITMGHWGLGVLVFGGALFLIGLTVATVRR